MIGATNLVFKILPFHMLNFNLIASLCCVAVMSMRQHRQKNASTLALVSSEEPAQEQFEFSFKVILGVGRNGRE